MPSNGHFRHLTWVKRQPRFRVFGSIENKKRFGMDQFSTSVKLRFECFFLVHFVNLQQNTEFNII